MFLNFETLSLIYSFKLDRKIIQHYLIHVDIDIHTHYHNNVCWVFNFYRIIKSSLKIIQAFVCVSTSPEHKALAI